MGKSIIKKISNLFNNNHIEIEELLAHRTDLGTFIIHLTRDFENKTASDNLESIIRSWKIDAKSTLGYDIDFLKENCVKIISFTETPLEYLYILTEKIKGRQCEFKPYGIAITKKLARKNLVNPVWYIDMTPGHVWVLKSALDELIKITSEVTHPSSCVVKDSLTKMLPFIEHMGDWRRKDGTGKCKEFWWEREWRHVGDFNMPKSVIGLCPEDEIDFFENLVLEQGRSIRFIDPRWGLEKIIARMAYFSDGDVDFL